MFGAAAKHAMECWSSLLIDDRNGTTSEYNNNLYSHTFETRILQGNKIGMRRISQ